MLNQRKLTDPIVYTHLLFLVNSVLYSTSGYYILSTILFLCTVCSFLYHLSRETSLFWKRMDHLMCIISLIFIFEYLVLFAAPFDVLICLGWLLLSLVIYKAGRLNYNVIHTIWHWAVFIGNVLVWHFLIERS